MSNPPLTWGDMLRFALATLANDKMSATNKATARQALERMAFVADGAAKLYDAAHLCITNAECAAEYAGDKGHQNADTLTLKNAPNWPGVTLARKAVDKLRTTRVTP